MERLPYLFETVRILHDLALFGGEPTALENAEGVLDEGMTLSATAGPSTVAEALDLRGMQTYYRSILTGPKRAQLARADLESSLEIRVTIGAVGEISQSLFHVGLVRQVLEGDNIGAVPYFERALRMAEAAEDSITQSYALRHLGYAHLESNRVDDAEREFTGSLSLRRVAGFLPGVAAAMLAIVDLRVRQGRVAEARTLAEQARSMALGLRAAGVVSFAEIALHSMPSG